MDHCMKKGKHLVFIFIKMIIFVFISLMNFSFAKAIPRALSSQRRRQQLDYIQWKQDDDIIKLGVSEKQKPPGIGMHENCA
jgi:hypothetical protein